MKTLDEVIEAQETCLRGACDKCSYDNSNFDICDVKLQSDVLYYLKEYRETKKHLACLDDAEIRGDDTQIVNNTPLTWDELKNMEDKPVWVDMNGYKPNWVIVMNQDKRNGRLLLCGYDKVAIRIEINKEGEGIVWQAYRKERV